MSYIRSLSNPEGLYIWGDGKNVNIVYYKGKNRMFTIPSKTFNGLLRKYIKNYGEDTIYKKASIKEVWIKTKKLNPKFIRKILGKYDSVKRMRLSYANWHIDMWGVTWEYVTNHERKIL